MMKQACVSVDNCAGCPHASEDFDDEITYFCNELNKYVSGDDIDADCPLEDE